MVLVSFIHIFLCPGQVIYLSLCLSFLSGKTRFSDHSQEDFGRGSLYLQSALNRKITCWGKSLIGIINMIHPGPIRVSLHSISLQSLKRWGWNSECQQPACIPWAVAILWARGSLSRQPQGTCRWGLMKTGVLCYFGCQSEWYHRHKSWEEILHSVLSPSVLHL